MKSLIFVGFVLAHFSTDAKDLLRIKLDNQDKDNFAKFAKQKDLDIWSKSNETIEVEVPEGLEDTINKTFKAEVVIKDVEKAAASELKENEEAKQRDRQKMKRRLGVSRTDLPLHFQNYEGIVKWLKIVANEYKFVKLISIGKTYEGREMVVVRIGYGNEKKPAVFITGGLHAREWLGVASVTYSIHKLVTKRRDSDPRVRRLLGKFDFYILPVSNPDGYDFTFTSPRYRLWRKTMTPQKDNCTGADPNRNFDVEFGKAGVNNTNACSIIYPGPHAFSEPCTNNIRKFVMGPKLKNRIKLYYDVHAYSQMYFVPFAFNKSVKPDNDYELRKIANISNAALESVNGRNFTVGSPGEILYDASGSTVDWFKLKVKVEYAFGFEVFPTGNDSHIAFFARPEDIVPSGEEIFEAIATAADSI